MDCAHSLSAGGAVLPGSAGDADAGSAAVDRCAGRAGGRRGGGASLGGDGGAAGGGRGGGDSGGERPRTGAVGGGVRRQGGARGDDSAAGDLCCARGAEPCRAAGEVEGECVLARACVRGNAGPCDGDRVCARPAACAGRGPGQPDGGAVNSNFT